MVCSTIKLGKTGKTISTVARRAPSTRSVAAALRWANLPEATMKCKRTIIVKFFWINNEKNHHHHQHQHHHHHHHHAYANKESPGSVQPLPPHSLLHLMVPLLFSSLKTVQKTIRTWRPWRFRKKTDFEMVVDWLIDWVYWKCHGTEKSIDWLIACSGSVMGLKSRLIDWLID